ncbi:MAG: Fic family protein [Candidatus Cyclonatronum sp.]|uniref:Fic family protein n=1 Tax=Cyclonatronum sp. TaxID=3024185 RepID=UPI0025C437F5|nr:Fic/DOC family N-terminal domain-containing protein [Cyclonatronum sp.]MCH8487428.1 Fic family protein [Cyclonatronum sp.]
MFSPNIPYNDLPPLPPDVDLETKPVMRKLIKASRALSELNGALTNLPNPTLFLDTIHLQEAKSSSEIENIITTNDDLYRDIIADRKAGVLAVKEVLRYKEALWLGLERIEKRPFISTNLCVEMVQCIKQNSSGIRVTPGTVLANSEGKVLYTPPTGETVIRNKMSELERFINEPDNLDPLIKMALLHYQFEAIHPFADGNGRTGRILLLLYLKLSGLLQIPAIYLSEYIIRNKLSYYELLRGVTERQEWEPYVLYMLDMVEVIAQRALKQIHAISELMDAVGEQIKEQVPLAYSKELVEILFKLPYTKRQVLSDAGLGTLKTVGNYLSQLERAGILSSEKLGKEKFYINKALLKLLAKP